jgi:prepilin-type N-terminal cleavage/methylation domain-containing protein
MGKKHREGFTLIELLVAMMVLAIALGFGVPAFNDIVANNRMAGSVNDVVRALYTARSEALTSSRTVTMCASASWDEATPTCDAGTSLLQGWIVFIDRNANAQVDDEERVVQAHEPLPVAIASAAGSGADQPPPHYISFRSDGLLQNLVGVPSNGIRHLQFCDGRGNRDIGGDIAAGRWIALSPAGRPVINERVAVVQSDANPLGGC